ncbi:Unannotated [Lentimonas sp. CC19]|nr:Unannotated [Lentimonas sp. CC4]CAA6685577.1 Unannotated [Lentimonas sp. CC6]CAA6689678.1 Unannotated [Lentimonas sp. CC19]CAA6692706.1 Unannotated [Lentimonas sp. CC10]CAA7069267.1 Unannotated [Lentimonas sp. CC11]CAA7168897.1 Unannotated [Lentimonas sp. CC21]CAA7180739.1 Unannotated [Lentimonas sp. CC8]
MGTELLIQNAYSTTSTLNSVEGGYATRCIEFTVGDEPFTVGYLGFLDDYGFDMPPETSELPLGLSANHEVGLFSDDGILIRSITIESGTAPLYYMNYRWKKLAQPIVLEPNERYLLAGTNFAWDKGGELYAKARAADIQTSSSFTIHQTAHFAFSSTPTGLTYPNRILDGYDPVLIVNLAGISEDLDNDGTPDFLEESTFGRFDINPATDTDDDGHTDIEEAISGTNKNDQSSKLTTIWTPGESQSIRPSVLVDNRIYKLMRSYNLSSWTEIESITKTPEVDEVSFDISFDPQEDEQNCFFTIEVQLQP